MARQTETASDTDRPLEDIVTVSARARKGDKYLAFFLGDEEYGISIIKVKEIIGMINITALPQTPAFVKGVINLRGKVIPVIDLRLRFDMPAIGYTDRTCIVVVEIGEERNPLKIGIIVDSVSEVLNIRDSDIEDAPNFGMKLQNEHILGISKIEGQVKILLSIDKVINYKETISLGNFGQYSKKDCI